MASSVFTLTLGIDSQILEKGPGKNWNKSRPITLHRKEAKVRPFGAAALGKLYYSVRFFDSPNGENKTIYLGNM